MDPIYVTGHRNPDTDSIVAAMAYAALRNALGDREYKAACLGRVSDETQLVLDRFGFEAPTRITSMFTQVQDLEFDTPPVLDANVTVAQAWKTFQGSAHHFRPAGGQRGRHPVRNALQGLHRHLQHGPDRRSGAGKRASV